MPEDISERIHALEAQQARTKDAVRDFLQLEVKLDALKKKAVLRAKDVDNERLSNRHYVNALDSSLRAGGHPGLIAFLPDVVVGGLAAGEVRYTSRDEADDGEEPVSAVRCCIDGPAGPRFELPRVVKDGCWYYPAVWVAIDTGSVGFPGAIWMFTKVKLRPQLRLWVLPSDHRSPELPRLLPPPPLRAGVATDPAWQEVKRGLGLLSPLAFLPSGVCRDSGTEGGRTRGSSGHL